MTDPTLAPCPFCGSTNLVLLEHEPEWFVVSCNQCNAEGGYNSGSDSTTPDDARAAWNRRPEQHRKTQE
jgi:Lar family restriction alleviation protein